MCKEVYGALCPQINNSKLCILWQISKGKLKAVTKLYIGWKVFVHEMYLVCVHLIYLAMRCSYVAGHLENMTVSPCLDMATLSIGGRPVRITVTSSSWMKEEKGIRHRGEGAYLRCPVSTSVQFSLRNEGSSEYIRVCEGRESLRPNF